jgi:hypothetical protein
VEQKRQKRDKKKKWNAKTCSLVHPCRIRKNKNGTKNYVIKTCDKQKEKAGTLSFNKKY